VRVDCQVFWLKNEMQKPLFEQFSFSCHFLCCPHSKHGGSMKEGYDMDPKWGFMSTNRLRIAYKVYLMKMNIWKWQCHSHKFSICCIKEYLWKKLEFKMSMTNVIICGCFVIFTMPTKFSLVIIVVPQGWSTHWEIKSLRRLLKAI